MRTLTPCCILPPGGLLEQSWRANLAELEADLAASRAGWKVVVGHHPVRSNGEEHGDTPELRGEPSAGRS